jgi:serine protease
MDDGDNLTYLEPGRRIVLRLVEPTSTDVTDLLELDSPLSDFLRRNDIATERLVTSVSPKRLLEIERAGEGGDFRSEFSVTAFWLLDATRTDGTLDELVDEIGRLPGAGEAYRLPGLAVASALTNDPFLGNQTYLAAADVGIDAEWAWQLRPPRTGANVGFVDIELAWQSNHEDVPVPTYTRVGGRNFFTGARAYHGLANLGVVVATTNNILGVAAAAPGVTRITLASADFAGVPNFANAISAAASAPASADFDILLIELQTLGGLPVESTSGELAAIIAATGSGGNRIVIEAAGDGPTTGAVDLGGVLGGTDSGAIVVGAGASAVPHGRIRSNRGTRVDCYAWGDGVFTTGGIGTSPGPDPGQNASNRYSTDYSGTSSAAAIVASAALIVQSAYKASTLGARTPAEMRALLRANGTPCVAGDGIGTMPDLRKLLPDVYIRDDLPDDGTVPSTAGLSVSPDVIVTTAPIANPDASYGAGSGNENVNTLGEQVEAGQDNYVYVRMRNRGTGVADGTTATVHYSPAATLVNPGAWTLIGTTPPVDVGPNLMVAGPIVWASADIPATGHYCFIARVSHPLDPAPPAPAGSITAFIDYIRTNNNVAWRNFNVVDLQPNVLVPMAFLVAGAFDRERTFVLDFVPRLLRGVAIWFEAPRELMRLVPQGVLPEAEPHGDLVRVRLPDEELRIPRLRLPKNAAYRCRLLFRAESLSHGDELPTLAIRQFLGDTEVGRLTWALRAARDSYEQAS